MKNLISAACLICSVAISNVTCAQNSAPSSHFVFDDNFPGDIIVNEVRVPKNGEAMSTYYEALGWRGRGAGYAGIQVHPKAHLFIFSIWDHDKHSVPIRAVYHGGGTETVGFGGEGTGLKSWNFKLGWNTDVWYTLVSRVWQVGDHSYFGFWARAGDTGVWTHLVTMDVAVADAMFEGRTDAFIEDWLSTGVHPRTSHLRSGWKRKEDGSWFPFGGGRYSVNAWDLVEGKRSYNFRQNWDGGVAKDADGEYYFMTAGGKDTKPSSANPSQHEIARSRTSPDFSKGQVTRITARRTDLQTVKVQWDVDPLAAPQFEYQIELLSKDAAPAKTISDRIPHAREFEVDAVDASQCTHVRITCEDVFGRRSKPITTAIQ